MREGNVRASDGDLEDVDRRGMVRMDRERLGDSMFGSALGRDEAEIYGGSLDHRVPVR